MIAKALGAQVTAVCGTRMMDGVRALGADHIVDYTTGSLADTDRDCDVIIDTAGETRLRELRGALVDRGRLVIVGAEHSHRITGGLGRWLRAMLWTTVVSQQLRPFAAWLTRTDGLLGLDVFRREVGDSSEPVGHIEAYPP